MASALGGGILADGFAKGSPLAYARLCQAGSLFAWPFFLASTLVTNNFWVAIAATGVRYVIGEVYRAPNISMIKNSTPADKYPRYISAL